MKIRYIDWIWRMRGSLPLPSLQSPTQAFNDLKPLFEEKNTTYRVDGDTLHFTKTKQLPQDKMSVFDGGSLHIVDGRLHYDLISRALLACFLAPLLFYAMGSAGVALDKWRNPPEVVKAKAEAAKRRSKIKAESVPMNPVDKFLGAPTPEKKKDGEEVGKRNRKPSMTVAYSVMGVFFALWLFGRILEHKLIHTRFRKMLAHENLAAYDERVFAPEGVSA